MNRTAAGVISTVVNGAVALAGNVWSHMATVDPDKFITRTCGVLAAISALVTIVYVCYGIVIRRLEKRKLETEIKESLQERIERGFRESDDHNRNNQHRGE